MTAEKETQSAARRKRVQILKRLIILSLITSILIPIILCVILFIRINGLEHQIEQLQSMLLDAAQTGSVFGEMEEAGSRGAVTEQEIADSADIPGVSDSLSGSTAGSSEDADHADASDGLQNADHADAEDGTRKVYLTFDDGPSANTDAILDILAEYDIKATFFVVGKEGEWAEKAYKRIVEEGHTLGMHSYTHEYSTIYASVDAYAGDLNRLKEYLYTLTGIESRFVRFPGGSSNKVSDVDMKEFITYLNEEGLTYFDWNVSSRDASHRKLSAEEIVDNCMQEMDRQGTIIVLMHDAAGRDTTVEALPILIEKIQAMENTELLPITEDTVPVQHIKITQEETED